mmetsp:Transcript_31854/g.87689  ORF Transcript_31854/g.87689 Transcript_31854/m.87689 type:complete len:300 (+) Transcript_31854:131-1030(+)
MVFCFRRASLLRCSAVTMASISRLFETTAWCPGEDGPSVSACSCSTHCCRSALSAASPSAGAGWAGGGCWACCCTSSCRSRTCWWSCAMISRCLMISDCSLLMTTGFGTHLTIEAFCAKRSVERLASMASSAGVIVTSMPVWELPPRCTESRRVSLESRMGTCSPRAASASQASVVSARRSRSANFSMTFPRKKSDLLMELDSAMYSVPASMRSLPARSTMTRRPTRVTLGRSSPSASAAPSEPSSGTEHSTQSVRIVCDREETSLYFVWVTRRRFSAVANNEMTSSAELTIFSFRPST